MRKHCSDVCKLRLCLNKESKNSARLRTIVTTALQQQYSQTELIFWILLVYGFNCNYSNDSGKRDDMWLGGAVISGL